MRMNSKVCVATLIFCATVSTAIADSYYGAVDFGQITVKDFCTVLPGGLNGCQDTASLIRVAGGYQITPMWGAEISYGSYGKSSLGTGSGVSAEWQINGLQLSGIATLPIAAGFSSFVKFGVARTDLKLSGNALSNGNYSASSTQFAYGFGAQYDFTKEVSVRAQYEGLGNVGNSNTGTYQATLFSAGLVYKF